MIKIKMITAVESRLSKELKQPQEESRELNPQLHLQTRQVTRIASPPPPSKFRSCQDSIEGKWFPNLDLDARSGYRGPR